MYRRTLTGFNIERLRLEKGYSKSELARKMGIPNGEISQFESAKKGISEDMEKKLCAALECSVEELYRPINNGLPEMLAPVVKLATEIYENSTLEKQHELCAKILKGLRENS